MSRILQPVLSESTLRRITNTVYQVSGYDFRDYSPSSLSRRTVITMNAVQAENVDDFIDSLVNDKQVLVQFLSNLSINVTSMFRDPDVYLYLKTKVLPVLATYPHIRIWSAGCATGEEAWSLAIMLKEAGLYERSLIYATDFNPAVLHKAFEGKVALEKMSEYTENYLQAGGEKAFSHYYTTTDSYAHMRKDLRENIIFSTHNLATDSVFNEFHLILCRNVLIYFDNPLQDRVIRLFQDSLTNRGFLCLGNKESLNKENKEGRYFDSLSKNKRIYKLI